VDWIEGIQRAIDYIEKNIEQELNSEILSSKIYVSSYNFQRMFSRFHGISPSTAKKNKLSLNTFSCISVKSNLSGGKEIMNDFSKRGYVVKETGAVYYTPDMDKTLNF
jgi:AraC family transcriptional regulator